MYEVIEIDGHVYPIRFGMNALRKYTKKQGLSLEELGKIGQGITLDDACVLVYCGIEDGCRKSKQDFKLSVDDIADALDADFTILEKAMKVFEQSFAPSNSGNGKGGQRASRKKS
jgi:hypothetical protein